MRLNEAQFAKLKEIFGDGTTHAALTCERYDELAAIIPPDRGVFNSEYYGDLFQVTLMPEYHKCLWG